MKIVIDNRPVEVPEGTTILRAAQQAGIPIPHLCFHPAFVPEGSCRICLVEIEGLPKLELACSTVIRDGMNISTQNPRVREARRGVLEFLLADHPLDCPICDKAGECKLQNYYQEYGLFENAFKETKERREKLVRIGRSLILDRERCILCTRCVRFLSDITKTQELGVFRRGIRSEISTYEDIPVDNNYAGNLVDLCPVGAITDMDFRFRTRAWFLNPMESVCPSCSRGCNIYVDYHPGFARMPGTAGIFRIRARENPEVNGPWICDYGRTSFRPLAQDRWDKILWRKEGRETILSWEKALGLLAEKLRSRHIVQRTRTVAVIVHTWLMNEDLFLVKKIFRDYLGVNQIFLADPKPGNADGFLLQAERSPNVRGAQELGLDLNPVDLEVLSKNTDFVIIFGPFLAEHFPPASLKAILDKIETKALLTSRGGGLESHVDFVLPTSGVLEKSGSWTNKDGRVQSVPAVCPPCGENRPEWSILVGLAKELKIDNRYYGRLTDPKAILQVMGREIPFFK